MFAFRTINMFSQAVVSCTDALASFPQPSFLKNRKEIDVKKILASFLKPSTFLKKCSLLLCFSVLIGCGEDGAVSVSAKHTAATQEQESGESVCLEIPKALTQGTGNLAIFNSLNTDVLLSYSSNLNTDDVIAVIGAKQKGVKVDISKRTSSIVTVFAFKMPAVQDYFKADCEDSQMPTAFMQSGFIPSAKSSFVIGTEESNSDYGMLMVRNNRDEKVSIFQGSSQNQQIGVIASKELNYQIKIPVGASLLMFYSHKDSGEIDFQNPVLVKNLVFNKDDKKRIIIPKQQVLSVAKINFLNSSDQDVMLTVRNSDEALFNVECSCPDLNKDDSNFKMILVNGRHYPNGNANDFFFSVVSLDTGQTLIRSKPFQLDKNTNLKFTLNKNLTLTKDLVNAVVAKNQEPEKPEDLKISQVTSNSLQLSWSPSADPDGEVTGYEVSHKTGNGNWQVGTDTTQTNVIVSGLQPDTSYTFRVRAKDDENAWSDYEESKPVQTLPAANKPPEKPSNISTSDVTADSIKVSWTAATDSDGQVSGYEISYKTGNGFWSGTSTTTDTAYTFQSLQPATSYTFRIRAKDDDGDWSPYQTSTAVSTAPNAPTALAVSARSLTFNMTSGNSYECSKDAGTTKTNCNSPFSFGDDAIAKDKLCVRVKASGNTPASDWACYDQDIAQKAPAVSQAVTWNFDNGNKPNGLTGNWSVVSGGANSTSKSLKSANISSNQQACVQTTRNVSAGDVEFQYKVSSEQNYDELFFYIDSAEKLGGKSGNIGWTQASYAVSAGSHTFKWCYKKDYALSRGDDAAWIDQVNFPDSSAASHDISKFTWKEIKPNDNTGWSKRAGHTSVVFQNKLWIMGGGYPFSNEVWSSSDGKNWTKITSSAGWSRRDNYTSVVFNNKIWVMGGYDGRRKNDVWSSSDGKNWTKITSSAGWSSRYGHNSVVFNNKIWVIGGNDRSYKNDVWSSSDGKNWTKVTDAAGWSSRYGHTNVVFNNKIWVIGGYDGSYKNDVWSSVDGKNWAKVTDSAGWSSRYEHTSVVFNNKIWVIGGGGGPYNNDVWSSVDGKNWTKVTDSAGWSRRHTHTSVVFNNKIWVTGGYGGSNKNDVWAFGPPSSQIWSFEDNKKPSGLSGNWSVVSGGASGSSKSLKSASIGNNQETCVQTTQTVSDGQIKFHYKVSSERRYDKLFFYIGSSEKLGGKSGTIAWKQASFNVSAGSHTFKWCYKKDSSDSEGSDAVWIDDVQFPQ